MGGGYQSEVQGNLQAARASNRSSGRLTPPRCSAPPRWRAERPAQAVDRERAATVQRLSRCRRTRRSPHPAAARSVRRSSRRHTALAHLAVAEHLHAVTGVQDAGPAAHRSSAHGGRGVAPLAEALRPSPAPSRTRRRRSARHVPGARRRPGTCALAAPRPARRDIAATLLVDAGDTTSATAGAAQAWQPAGRRRRQTSRMLIAVLPRTRTAHAGSSGRRDRLRKQPRDRDAAATSAGGHGPAFTPR
jgi:hypothetical protein